MSRLRGVALAIGSLLVLSRTAPAQGVDSIARVSLRPFVARLQAVVRGDSASAFASLVHFPLIVNRIGGHTDSVRTAERLRQQYRSLMTANVRAAILGQAPDDVFRNWQGYMIGDGQVWFDEGCDYATDAPICFSIRVINRQAPGVK